MERCITNVKIIHLWISGMEETGGIQHYSICCAQALRELYPNASLRIFSMNDTHGDVSMRFHAFGRWHRNLRALVFALTGIVFALRERPDFIFATHPHFAKALAPLSYLGMRCLAAAHGVETWGLMGGTFGVALRRLTGILPVSEYTREIIGREAKVPMKKMCVVADTFRQDCFNVGPKCQRLLARYGIKPDQPVILTIGRISSTEQYKGHDRVLYAMPSLLTEYSKLHYIIGGCGDDEPRLRQICVRLGIEMNVTFAGFIHEDELADHYRLADLYVMPSTGEGFGIVYLEALACGRPCLVGNRDAAPEAIDHGRLGMVVDPLDAGQISAAIGGFFSGLHDKSWLYEPEFLHNEVVRLYGREAFLTSLKNALNRLLL
jgi:glycosyltransferase involved in cell wall biosynthesis